MEIAAGPAPVRAKDRYESLDVIRGVALVGILLMNITGFGLPDAYDDPTVSGGATGWNLWAWQITEIGFEGTQRGLFSLLFGAGVILLTSRLEAAGRTDVADIYYRRNLWLIVFGIVHAYLLLWWGEILYAYGVTALFLYALRNLAPRWLIAIGVAGFIVSTAWNYSETRGKLDMAAESSVAEKVKASGAKLTEGQQKAIDDWKEHVSEAKPDAKALKETIDARRGSYGDVLESIIPLNHKVQSWWMYRFFFDIFSMMLFGMALFKLGVLTLELKTSTYLAMAVAGYAVGVTTNTLEVRWILDHGFSVLSFAEAEVSYDLGRVAMTIGHLGALLLFCKSGVFGWLRRSLAAVGTLAFTNYVSHSLICAVIFYGFGFGLYGQLERHQLYSVVFGIWLFQLIVSPIWLRYFRYGPLEWVWRWLTYLKRPPMRRKTGGATAAAI